MCHFQIAPGLVVFSISEFKAVPRSRCNHLCDPRAAISRQRSVTLYFFFLLSFLPPPFFSFSLRFRFISFPPFFPYTSLFASSSSYHFSSSRFVICSTFLSCFFSQNLVHRISSFLSFLFFSRTWFDSDTRPIVSVCIYLHMP